MKFILSIPFVANFFNWKAEKEWKNEKEISFEEKILYLYNEII